MRKRRHTAHAGRGFAARGTCCLVSREAVVASHSEQNSGWAVNGRPATWTVRPSMSRHLAAQRSLQMTSCM